MQNNLAEQEQRNEEGQDFVEKIIGLEVDIVKEIANVQKYKKKMEGYYYLADEPGYDKNVNYYELFWKTYIINQLMFSQIKENSKTNNDFNAKMQNLTNKIDQYFEKINSKKKNRRLDTQITKTFSCPYQKCFKSYGSQVSLNLHVKTKHNGGTKTQRQHLTKQYIKSLKNGLPSPKFNISFPPGYLQVLFPQQQNLKKQNNHNNQNK